MRIRFGLRARFILMFLVFSVLISSAAGYMMQKRVEHTIWTQYQNNAIKTANLAASFIDGDQFEHYAVTLQKDEEYERIQENLNNVRRASKMEYIYALKVVSDSETIYVFDTWDMDTPVSEIGLLGGREPYDSSYTGIAEALRTKKTNESFEVTRITRFGFNATIYAPIINSDGKAVGVVGVDVAMNDINSTAMEAVKELLSTLVMIIVLFFLVLLAMVQKSFIHPIRVLQNSVEKMAEGRLGVQTPVQGSVEIKEISIIFNQMSSNIEAHMKEMNDLTDGYQRFVPEEIFHILHKKAVTQVWLGDHRETILSILGMGIKDFDKVSVTVESKELFTLLNQVYKKIVPVIQRYGGVVGEYDKKGLLAFYQNSCQEALDGAIVLCQSLEGRLPLKLGFGISHGMVMMGIVGDKRRLSASMLSEQITASQHLKAVVWKYGAQILITGTAAGQISDFSAGYASRLVGLLHLKISGKTEKFYDVYEGDSVEEREYKELTKGKFEEGVMCFIKKEFYQARCCFIEVLKLYRLDYAAREYLYLCNCYYQDSKAAQEANVWIEEC